jgi:ABC-2 type transport system permease protein
MISTVIKFPLVFISGIFVPLGNLPEWGKIFAYISPLTYFTDLVRYSVNQNNYFHIGIDFLALLIFSVVFYVLAIKLHQRNIPRRI